MPRKQSKNLPSRIGLYANKACTQPIKSIEWNSTLTLNLFGREPITLKNVAQPGKPVTTAVWVRNEEDYTIYVETITFHDSRVKFSIDSAELHPKDPVKLTISYTPPVQATKDAVVRPGKIKIEGHIVYGG